MNNQLTTTNQNTWQRYFSVPDALNAVNNHLETLPSARSPEKHTRRVYTAGLRYFLEWASGSMPTELLLEQFISHLKSKGLKSSTIGCKYLAPVRLFIKKLNAQIIPLEGMNGGEFFFINECKQHLTNAATIKTPRPETSTNRSALYAHGKRLNLLQVNQVFQSIDRETLLGQRDIALLYLGFTTGLRIAELARVTLASIAMGTDCYEIKIRGKRNNVDPVPIDSTALGLINDWVEAFNAAIPADDPRRITENTPIWQPLGKNDAPRPIGVNGYKSGCGITTQAIRGILARRVKHALGFTIAPHDMRRTVAAIGRQSGMDYDELRMLLRHKNVATTARYVGNPPNLSASIISNRVNFDI